MSSSQSMVNLPELECSRGVASYGRSRATRAINKISRKTAPNRAGQVCFFSAEHLRADRRANATHGRLENSAKSQRRRLGASRLSQPREACFNSGAAHIQGELKKGFDRFLKANLGPYALRLLIVSGARFAREPVCEHS